MMVIMVAAARRLPRGPSAHGFEKAAQETLASLGREAIEAIREVATQRDVEARLGLSPGYLSKVKRGARSRAPRSSPRWSCWRSGQAA